MRLKCPACATIFTAAPGPRLRCPHCGHEAPAPRRATVVPSVPSRPVQFSPPLPPPPVVAVPASAEPPKALSRRRAVAGSLLNVVAPGAGTLLFGRRVEGTVQVSLLALGLLTVIFLVGLAILAGVWAWAQVTSFQILNEPTPQTATA